MISLLALVACRGCALTGTPPGGAPAMKREFEGPGLPSAAQFPSELSAKMREALAAHGPDYKPRTHHLRDDATPKYINRLIFETSPYLLQHAHNPVNWYPWGPEAFAAAKALHVPVLLSIGYSTCHWCHVMEVESFEDEQIAEYINQHFVAIKVDREERPDIDGMFMNVVMMMNHGSGGWPMTVVMTPEGKPFFGGTYFPPRDGARGARMGLLTILQKLTEAYARDPGKIEEGAGEVLAILDRSSKRFEPQGIPGPAALAEAARLLAAEFDPKYGGFGSAPKFPRPATYELLLRYWRRTGDEAALFMVSHSLENMVDGGIWDHLGGGFHRYSTDEKWLVPHFEKMLYDNAQLASLLIEAFRATRDASFAEKARETLDYVAREMTSPEGGFYSATDADSEGAEGRFFVWTPAELEAVLGASRARIAAEYWDVTAGGNFEGRNILHAVKAPAEIAEKLGVPAEEIERELEAAKLQLRAAREQRVHPLLDDKVLAEWNAQMISAFAQAAIAFGEPQYAARAVKAADLVLGKLRREGRMLRAYRKGTAKHSGVLEDYAFFVAALLDVFEATGAPRWLEEAISLQDSLDRHFWDSRGGAYFSTADDGEALPVRDKPAYDGAQPSGNSVAAMNLFRLAELTGKEAYRSKAERTLGALAAMLERGASESPKLAAALDWYLDAPKEVIIVTAPGDDGRALRAAFGEVFLPNRILVMVEEGAALAAVQRLVPLVENKRAIGGKATAYVCVAGACKLPTSSPEVFAKQLAEVEMLPLQKKLRLPR